MKRRKVYAHGINENRYGVTIPYATVAIILDYVKENKQPLIWQMYMFYVKCAVWQKTFQPYATNRFVAKGLDWSMSTVEKYRAILIREQLLVPIRNRKANGQIGKPYTRVNYLSYEEPLVLGEKTTGLFEPALGGGQVLVGGTVGNAYDKKGKCLSQRKPIKDLSGSANTLVPNERSFEMKCAKSILNAMKLQKVMTRIPLVKTIAKQLVELQGIDHIPRKRIIQVFKWFIHHATEQFTPRIFKVADLRVKFGKLEDARKRWMHDTKDADVDDDFVEARDTILPDGTIRT